MENKFSLLKDIREKIGFKQNVLAKEIRLTPIYLSSLENGKGFDKNKERYKKSISKVLLKEIDRQVAHLNRQINVLKSYEDKIKKDFSEN